MGFLTVSELVEVNVDGADRPHHPASNLENSVNLLKILIVHQSGALPWENS
jgi:hypothetical protein